MIVFDNEADLERYVRAYVMSYLRSDYEIRLKSLDAALSGISKPGQILIRSLFASAFTLAISAAKSLPLPDPPPEDVAECSPTFVATPDT